MNTTNIRVFFLLFATLLRFLSIFTAISTDN